MKLISQIGVVFFICWFSFVITDWLPFPFPSGVLALLIVWGLLMIGALKIKHLRDASDFLLSQMAFFVLPVGVSVMGSVEFLRAFAVQLLIICIVSTVITFGASAVAVKYVLKLTAKRSEKNNE